LFQNSCKQADIVTAADSKFVIRMLVLISKQDYFPNTSEDLPNEVDHKG